MGGTMSPSMTRRGVLLAAAGSLIAPTVSAQDFPSRPIRMLVGFSAGGGTDAIARIYAQRLQLLLNTPIIVENRPGAGQLLATRAPMSAQPDGYTIFMGTASGLALGPGIRRDLPYDPLTDFTLIGLVASTPGMFVVNPRLPARSMAELIAYARANPGTLNYGSAGIGASSHILVEYLKQVTGVDMVHVPYRSDEELSHEILAGNIQVGLSAAQSAIPLVSSGKLRALAVTGSERLRALPDVPSLAEVAIAGLDGIHNFSFYGLVGPRGMSQPVTDRLNAAINAVPDSPEALAQMRDTLRYDPMRGTPADFRRYLEGEIARWREVGTRLELPS